MKTPTSALAEYQMISGHHEVRHGCSGQKKTRVLEENLQTPSFDIGILYPDKKEVKRFSAKKIGMGLPICPLSKSMQISKVQRIDRHLVGFTIGSQ